MAKEIVRHGNKALTGKSKAIDKAKSVEVKHGHPARQAKKAAKHAAEKHAARKNAKKAAKHAGEKTAKLKTTEGHRDGLVTAFHHMQRASVVVSLMEKGTGEDLRDLLERGVKLYEVASEDNAGERKLSRAVGVLRAAEHLALAGLYAARSKHRQKVAAPGRRWLKDLIAGTETRLEKIEGEERGKGPDLHPVSVELLRQAEDADSDAHLAFELAMAADALCFALENGL